MASSSESTLLREYISHWPDQREVQALSGPRQRLVDAIGDLRAGTTYVGCGDIIGLCMQVLSHESIALGGSAGLSVPAEAPWPTAATWRNHGFTVSDEGDRLNLKASRWKPMWLDGPQSAIDLALSVPYGLPASHEDGPATSRRRPDSSVRGDPFFEEILSVTGYKSDAQREAVRAVLTSPPGMTLLVGLPTGMGKSAVALVPAMLADEGALTVFVVPTTALALDQDRALRRYRPPQNQLLGPSAYHSGLSEIERQGFRNRIRNGTQRVIFASPESVLTSLKPSLYAAAETGRLAYLVIDEAHMVTEWGEEFRPEFQHLAGLRWDLLRLANTSKVAKPFKTILLSATLTETSIETLDVLFGGESIYCLTSASIRPEPAYLIGQVTSNTDRLDKLVEAVIRLPKPLIIYVSKPGDADRIQEHLRGHGFKRVRVVTGGTDPGRRLQVIHEWRGEPSPTRADIVVASSAFGLGVDMDDVRTVIHACVPETMDRYYQEVGRGGRDGHASISLILPLKEDLPVARKLSVPTLITAERGRERWRAMIERAYRLEGMRYRTDLRARPSDLALDSDESWRWNLRTLALMARAGMIRLQAERPQFTSEEEPQEPSSDSAEGSATANGADVIVELRRGDLGTESVWEGLFNGVRRQTYQHFRSSHRRVLDLIRGSCPVRGFRDTYKVGPMRLSNGERLHISPVGECRGCPSHAFTPDAFPIDVPGEPYRGNNDALSETLLQLLHASNTLLVTYSAGIHTTELRRSLRRLIRSLVSHGIREVVAGPDLLSDERLRTLHRRVSGGYLFLSESMHPVAGAVRPAVQVVLPSEPHKPIPLNLVERGQGGPALILVVPAGSTDPIKHQQQIAKIRSPHWDIHDLLRVL